MPRSKIEDSEKLIHNLAVKFRERELRLIEQKSAKAGKKPGTWAREALLKVKA